MDLMFKADASCWKPKKALHFLDLFNVHICTNGKKLFPYEAKSFFIMQKEFHITYCRSIICVTRFLPFSFETYIA